MKKTTLFSILGCFLGLGAPLGCLLIQWFMPGAPEDFLAHCRYQWAQSRFFYLYMLFSTVTAFYLYGFFVGKYTDLVDHQNYSLSKQARSDSLTGLVNHRYMHEVFNQLFEKHLESAKPLSCIMMDLDHFKKVNDTYGHVFGDKILQTFAFIIEESIRAGDLAARYGGEEFLCVLPDCDAPRAKLVAERIRRTTEEFVYINNGQTVRVTVSMGVVTVCDTAEKDYRATIQKADQALYRAKHEGRNRVVFSD